VPYVATTLGQPGDTHKSLLALRGRGERPRKGRTCLPLVVSKEFPVGYYEHVAGVANGVGDGRGTGGSWEKLYA
jgi:hypothetical protein